MKKKILIALVVVLAGGGFAAKSMLMTKAVAKTRISGTIYGLPKQFTLNMADGRYATLTVALILAPGQSDGMTAADSGGVTTTPDGFGPLPEEPVIRSIITNLVTNDNSSALLSDGGRSKLQTQILHEIKTTTDVKVSRVLFTDVAVQ